MTILGEDYVQHIDPQTSKWKDSVIDKFQELFENRIRYLFEAETVE